MANIKEKELNILERLVILIGGVFLFLLISGKASLFLCLGIAIIALIYFLGRKYLWLFLVLAPISLIFGQIIYIQITTGWVYEASLAEIFLGLAAVVYFLDIYLNNKFTSVKIDQVIIILLIYLLFSLAAVFYAIDWRLYIFGLKVGVFSFLAYFLSLNLLREKKQKIFLLISLCLTGFILSLGVMQKFYGMGFSSEFFFSRNTIIIPFGPLATTAAMLSFLAPIILGFYFSLTPSNKSRPYIFILFIFSFLGVFISLGKGAIISLLIGLSYLFLKLKKKRPAFLLFFLVFILLGYLFLNPFLAGIFTRVKTTLVDVNTEFRIKEYKAGWELFSAHPWFGVGPGQQLIYFEKMLDMENRAQVNNFLIQALLDLGLIGGMLVFWLLINIYRKTKKILLNKNNQDIALKLGFTAGAIVAFFNGLVEVTFFALPYAIIFWLVLGIFLNDNKKYV
ncbi:hypothetical protein DRH27_00605 [Candidatus Falkowbacteria bacterium]|nr:MAG: hypothetical protein DRH27_00605 [Candidatus Falkowbacteria bacterium]